MKTDSSGQKPCARCKKEDASFTVRNTPTCQSCYEDYARNKVVKRLEHLHQGTRTSKVPKPQYYVAALSLGSSSSVLVHILDRRVRQMKAKKSLSPVDALVIHVDTDLSRSAPASGPADEPSPASKAVDRYRQTYSALSFECVHLSKVLEVDTVDWSTLPLPTSEAGAIATERLRGLFDRLPSATSRADILRLLIRHLLLHIAMQKSSMALLLGHTTTALAALTMSEVANGRGFSVPWQVDDGRFPVCTYSRASADAPSVEISRTEFPVYYPLRELYKSEVSTFVSFTPSISELLPADDGKAASAVVSHKDVSIEEIMARYFEGVEGPYSGIIANVVRTTGKLDRVQGEAFCGLCGVTLDEQGDSRWAGELGQEESEGDHHTRRLCYGCKRSING